MKTHKRKRPANTSLYLDEETRTLADELAQLYARLWRVERVPFSAVIRKAVQELAIKEGLKEG